MMPTCGASLALADFNFREGKSNSLGLFSLWLSGPQDLDDALIAWVERSVPIRRHITPRDRGSSSRQWVPRGGRETVDFFNDRYRSAVADVQDIQVDFTEPARNAGD